jgi:hypothetical protein
MDILRLYAIVALVNICACTLLVLFGFCSNALSLMVFWHSKHKTPKIGARDYLTILTIVNSLFLVIYWYNMTGPLILAYFDFRPDSLTSRFFNLKDSYSVVCKLVNYSQQVTRCLSTLLTLAFTLERTLAIYFPFKLRHYKQNVNFLSMTILCCLVLFSVLISIDSFVFYEVLDQSTDNSTNLVPYLSCQIAYAHQATHNRITYFVAIFTLVIPFMLIIVSNVAIVLRLKRAKKTLHSGSSRGSTKSNIVLFSGKNNASLQTTTPVVSLNQLGKNSPNLIASGKCELDTPAPRLFRPSLNSHMTTSLSYLNLNETSLTGVSTATGNNLSIHESGMPSKGDFSSETLSSLHNSEFCSSCSFKSRIVPEKCTGASKANKKQAENTFTISRTNRIKRSSSNRAVHLVIYKSNRSSAGSASLTSKDVQQPCVKLFEVNSNEEPQIVTQSNRASCTSGFIRGGGSSNTTWTNKRQSSLQRRFSMDNMSLMRVKSRSEQDFVWHCANKKMHSTKVLIILTSFYIILHIPHFIDIFLTHNIKLAEAHESIDGDNNTRFVYHMLMMVGGIFYLSNFSVSGLLMFASGKIYRRHLYGLTVKLTRPFQKFKTFLISKFNNF